MTVIDLNRYADTTVHYVYLLVDQEHHRFKIGVSIDPVRRAHRLAQYINLSMSVQAGFTRNRAYAVETALHKMYREVNIDADVIGEVNGKTEWFNFDAFPACRNILKNLDTVEPLRRIRPRPTVRKDWVSECLKHIRENGAAWANRKPVLGYKCAAA